MFKDIIDLNSFDEFFSTITITRLRLLFYIQDWISMNTLMEKTGLSHGGLSYHLSSLERNGFVESRLLKWKNTFRKEYKALPLILSVNVIGKQEKVNIETS